MDDNGFPLLLADKKPDSAPQPAPDGTAGLHAPPSGITPEEWARRQDAVREAAREFETFAVQDAKEWLKGVTQRDLTDQEVAQFVADVHAQVIADVVDILDHNERGVLRARRKVRVVAPKGYVKKTVNALSDSEWIQVMSRLKTRGLTDRQIKGIASRHDRPLTPEQPSTG